MSIILRRSLLNCLISLGCTVGLTMVTPTMAKTHHAATTKKSPLKKSSKKRVTQRHQTVKSRVTTNISTHAHGQKYHLAKKHHNVHKLSKKQLALRQAELREHNLKEEYENQRPKAYSNLKTALNLAGDDGRLLSAKVAYAVDLDTGKVLFSKNSNAIQPIASISKLMTALVIVDAHLPMDEPITITENDVDHIKNSSSRLLVGTTLTRRTLLHLALMSSENRAAHALARTYPRGLAAFVAAMNAKARSLGMTHTRYVEPTGLSPENISSPKDLVKLIRAVSHEPLIHEMTTSDGYEITTSDGRERRYRNTNRLIRNPNWDITISKTGYIREAGDCLVMRTIMDGRPVAVVLLDSGNTATRFSDAIRLRKIVQQDYPKML